jgi:bacteriocin biosynthesis cyclodehydratase domain-containing protein
MTLRLDPRFPLLWRTPTSLQLGVDGPAVLLPEVAIGHERMIAALGVGVTSAGLDLIGAESGLDAIELADFRERIRPALLETSRPVEPRVAVAGSGPTADRLAWRLREAGLDARPTGERPEDAGALPVRPGDLAVVVGHYVLDPEFRGLWLRRDTPHLPVVYGDALVRIGPFVEPGTGPCLYCLERHAADADPAWPALAGQLLGRRSGAETRFLASEAATIAARLVLSRATGSAAAIATSVTIDAESGALNRREWARHPECACAGLPELTGADARDGVGESRELSVPDRRGTGTGRSRPGADRSRPTTTGEAVSVPA